MEDTIPVPLWKLKIISNTLRMVSNVLDSPKRESCLSRNVMQSWNFVEDIIQGKVPTDEEALDYYTKVGQKPTIPGK